MTRNDHSRAARMAKNVQTAENPEGSRWALGCSILGFGYPFLAAKTHKKTLSSLLGSGGPICKFFSATKIKPKKKIRSPKEARDLKKRRRRGPEAQKPRKCPKETPRKGWDRAQKPTKGSKEARPRKGWEELQKLQKRSRGPKRLGRSQKPTKGSEEARGPKRLEEARSLEKVQKRPEALEKGPEAALRRLGRGPEA